MMQRVQFILDCFNLQLNYRTCFTTISKRIWKKEVAKKEICFMIFFSSNKRQGQQNKFKNILCPMRQNKKRSVFVCFLISGITLTSRCGSSTNFFWHTNGNCEKWTSQNEKRLFRKSFFLGKPPKQGSLNKTTGT